jgi:hypothetical protein
MMMMDCHTPWSMSYLWGVKNTHIKEFWICLPTGVWRLGPMLGLVGYFSITIAEQLFINVLLVDRRQDSSVGIVTGHELDGRCLILSRSKTFLFFIASRLALGSI